MGYKKKEHPIAKARFREHHFAKRTHGWLSRRKKNIQETLKYPANKIDGLSLSSVSLKLVGKWFNVKEGFFSC